MTLLCIPILADSIESALEDARAAKGAGADLVEFRVDHLFDPGGELGEEMAFERVERLVRESPLPCIVTCRPASEGGEYDGDEQSRIALFQRLGAMDHPPRFLDVELETYTRSANLRQKIHLAVDHPDQLRDLTTSLILSFHDFQGRPADLLRRMARMRSEPGPPEGAAAIHKIAFRARSVRDNLELFDLLAERDRPTIALAMGEPGLMSRVLAPKFGGFLTFASLRPETTTAPGQPTIDELLNLYRLRSISPSTRVYGVIGWPVAHSLSPLVQNAGFHTPAPGSGVEHDGVHLPLPVPPEWESFKATLLSLVDHPRLDFSGASVTIPHKEHLFRLAQEQGWAIDPLAARIGAANTLVVDREAPGAGAPSRVRAARVANTDAPAAVECLRDAMGPLQGRRIALLGAGGVAGAVATGLVDEGATVVIHNRAFERAERLAQRVQGAMGEEARSAAGARCVAAQWDKRGGSGCEAFVNCTPLGMTGSGHESESALPAQELKGAKPGTVVMDTVYTPLRTPLLRAALDSDLPIIDGVTMFVRQAQPQFRAWTGREAPSGLFERLVRERLAQKSA